MQKVVGSSPISRFAGPWACPGRGDADSGGLALDHNIAARRRRKCIEQLRG